MIAAEDSNAVAASYDVTSSAQCTAMVEDAVSRWGRLDCLDNNVGIGSKGTVVEETEDNWACVMHVNVDTMFLACKHAIPAMIRTAGGGAIVDVSSISALRPRGLTAYTVSKGAVIALTKAIAVDHGADGIRANCVAPGPVYTPMVYARGMTEQARDTRRQASVLKREGTGWDIGGAVRFLLLHHRPGPGRGRWGYACRPEPGIAVMVTIRCATAKSGRIVQAGKCRASAPWAGRGPRVVRSS
jgi:NAD(P)-dependent dehydrogenase (short-subunit alcohol dehydrogenase family)